MILTKVTWLSPRASVTSLVWCILCAWASTASGQDNQRIERELMGLEADTERLSQYVFSAQPERKQTFAEERLADGELYFRLKDYERASILFWDITTNFKKHEAYPDALILLGDSLYKSGDYAGARIRYEEILQRVDERAFRPYAQRALARLLDVVTRTGQFRNEEKYLNDLDRWTAAGARVASSQRDSNQYTEFANAIRYYRGKYLYLKSVPFEEVVDEAEPSLKNLKVDKALLAQARQQFSSVSEKSSFFPHSLYFAGASAVLESQYAVAIPYFQKLSSIKVQTTTHQQLVELAWLALGRIYYEIDNGPRAIRAYQSIPRTSPNFELALYELAWVYIRLGDSRRAEQALELLAVVAPKSRYLPEAGLLRGNLLIREGRFADAKKNFDFVKRQFEPVQKDVDEFISAHPDTQEYFFGLVRDNLEAFDADTFLPPLAVPWVRKRVLVDHAMGVVSDFSRAKHLNLETEKLARRVRSVVDAPNAPVVFVDSRHQRQSIAVVQNQLAQLRRVLIDKESKVAKQKNVTGIEAVVTERASLDPEILQLPMSDAGFVNRDDSLLSENKSRERQLRELDVEVSGLEARAAALSQYLNDGVHASKIAPEQVRIVRSEVETQKGLILKYRENLDQLKYLVEVMRLHVGVGDDRTKQDEAIRARYIELVDQEHAHYMGASVAPSQASDSIFGRIRRAEERLHNSDALVQSLVEQRVQEIRRVIDEETENLTKQREALVAIQSETEKIAGVIAYDNLNQVRKTFNDVIRRADVGSIDVAWAEREEHRMRVDVLSRERSREVTAIDDEFRDIMDDAASKKKAEGSSDEEAK